MGFYEQVSMVEFAELVERMFPNRVMFTLQMNDHPYRFLEMNQNAELEIYPNRIEETIDVLIRYIYGGKVNAASPFLGTGHEEQIVDGETNQVVASFHMNNFIDVDGWQKIIIQEVEKILGNMNVDLPIIDKNGNDTYISKRAYAATFVR